MKKILCPTDFSDTAHNAIAYAAKLAQVTQCDLTLFNVQSMFDFTPGELFRGKKATIAEVTAQLEAQSREVTRAFKIPCYADVEASFSKLSSVIQEKSKGYDLIVMGTDGPDDLYQFFAGSNTYNAILKSDTPLLLVPAGYNYSEIRHMIYAYDYLRERTLPIKRLMPLVRALNCRLTVLQVMEEAYSQVADEDLKELQFVIRSQHGDRIKFEFDTIRSSEIGQAVNSYILRNDADALALCEVHRKLIQSVFHKSVIKNISAISGYPVFVFQE